MFLVDVSDIFYFLSVRRQGKGRRRSRTRVGGSVLIDNRGGVYPRRRRGVGGAKAAGGCLLGEAGGD